MPSDGGSEGAPNDEGFVGDRRIIIFGCRGGVSCITPLAADTIVRVLMAVEPIMQAPDMWSGMVGVEALELARKELTSQADQLVKNVAERLRKTGQW